jgi:hypothetical protein
MRDELLIGTVEVTVDPEWCLTGFESSGDHVCRGVESASTNPTRYYCRFTKNHRTLRDLKNGTIRRPKFCPVKLQGE